jgi:hypothetical protein
MVVGELEAEPVLNAGAFGVAEPGRDGRAAQPPGRRFAELSDPATCHAAR